MSENVELLERSLLRALSHTMEEIAFEQVEKIADSERIDVFNGKLLNPESGYFTDSPGTDSGSGENEKFWAELGLKAPLSGIIVVEVSKGYASALCKVLYGMGMENPHDDMIRDSMAELLNTIGGCFMKELIPPEQEYEWGFPVTGKGRYETLDEPILETYCDINGDILKMTIVGKDISDYRVDHPSIQEGEL
ncbi:chemotaxis protein CheX [bacterium]|nr:chemotaxis protein CheX [bacterium]MBU1653024.1 chemotaxis protein CheX [bacterium]